MPSVADRLDWNNLRFEIVDMDGKRIDKVLVAQLQKTHADTARYLLIYVRKMYSSISSQSERVGARNELS